MLCARWWGISDPWIIALIAFAGVVGHNYPVWLSFKGGKGVATSYGVAFFLYPHLSFFVAPAGGLVWLLVLKAKGYVSLASMTSLCCLLFALVLSFLFRMFWCWARLPCWQFSATKIISSDYEKERKAASENTQNPEELKELESADGRSVSGVLCGRLRRVSSMLSAQAGKKLFSVRRLCSSVFKTCGRGRHPSLLTNTDQHRRIAYKRCVQSEYLFAD